MDFWVELNSPITFFFINDITIFFFCFFYFVHYGVVNFILLWLSSKENSEAIGSLGGAYTIILLLGIFNLSIGCLTSALTKNQLVAAMACFTFCMLHFLIGFILQDLPVPDLWRNGLFYVSTVNHVEVFINGLIDTRQLVYYLSFTALILLLTYNILEFRKWKA